MKDMKETLTRRHIVVGADGSAESLDAVEWAADEARLRDLPLLVVHVPEASFGVPVSPRETLADAAGLVAGRSPGLKIATEVHGEDVPGPVLVELSRDAALLVLGSRGLGTVAGALLGSVGLHTAAHARCPVILVRAGYAVERAPESPGGVVVGVDGDAPSEAAIAFAFEEAALRGVRLRAVLAALDGGAERLLAGALAGWGERFPGVDVAADVVRLDAAKALVAASRGADLLVVGNRARRGRVGLALGPVVHAVLHHARCPVAVVPERPAAPPR